MRAAAARLKLWLFIGWHLLVMLFKSLPETPEPRILDFFLKLFIFFRTQAGQSVFFHQRTHG